MEVYDSHSCPTGRQVLQAAKDFPSVVLIGPRRLFPTASYLLLEDSGVMARLLADPLRMSAGNCA